MRRPQLRRLQDRRTERLLRRGHTPEAAVPQRDDGPGGAVPIRERAPRADDVGPPRVPGWVAASAVGDAA